MTEPTDDELDMLIDDVAGLDSSGEVFRAFARAVLAKWGTPAGVREVVAVVGTDAGGVHLYYEGKYLGPQSAKKTVMLLKDLPLGTQLFTTPQPAHAQAGAVPLTDEQVEALITTKHFREGYELKASDRTCLAWYRLGVRDGERAHGIKGGQHGAE